MPGRVLRGPSLSCQQCRLKPFGRDFGSSLFPGGDYAVNTLETLNILGFVQPLVHQRNGAFDLVMVSFSLLPQSLYVEVVTLLEHNLKMCRWSQLYAYLPSADAKRSFR